MPLQLLWPDAAGASRCGRPGIHAGARGWAIWGETIIRCFRGYPRGPPNANSRAAFRKTVEGIPRWGSVPDPVNASLSVGCVGDWTPPDPSQGSPPRNRRGPSGEQARVDWRPAVAAFPGRPRSHRGSGKGPAVLDLLRSGTDWLQWRGTLHGHHSGTNPRSNYRDTPLSRAAGGRRATRFRI